jgi:hypothetical protein
VKSETLSLQEILLHLLFSVPCYTKLGFYFD